jgi:hypothetical protein
MDDKSVEPREGVSNATPPPLQKNWTISQTKSRVDTDFLRAEVLEPRD